MTAATKASDPTAIAVDAVFRRNATYNAMISPPVVLALQNAPKTVYYGYHIEWQLEGDLLSFYAPGDPGYMNAARAFNYTYAATALLVNSVPCSQSLEAGPYTFTWTYSMTTCTPHGDGELIQSGTLASDTLYITIVDQSGLDFRCGLPKLPWRNYREEWNVSEDCPAIVNASSFEPQPCKAKLNDNQIKCLTTYFAGDTDIQACEAGFDDVQATHENLKWKYAEQAQRAHSHAGADVASFSSSATAGSATSNPSGGPGPSSIGEGEGKTGIGNALCPCLGLVAAAVLALGILSF